MTIDQSPNLRNVLSPLVRDVRRSLDQLSGPEFDIDDAFAWLEQGERLLDRRDSDYAAIAEVLQNLVRVCIWGQRPQLLAPRGVPYPTYNYFTSFRENLKGPWDVVLPRPQTVSTPTATVLGHPVAFPVGIAASVLTSTATWIEYYARRGFNVLTYKTVRSQAFEAHPAPNWVFLEGLQDPLSLDNDVQGVVGDPTVWPADLRRCSTANSFGVPSLAPDEWQSDVADALSRIDEYQLLIVSVMGSHEKYQGDSLVDDFVRVAQLAEECGAGAIELNISCPNTLDPESGHLKTEFICESAIDTAKIVKAVRDGLRNDGTKLAIKMNHMPLAQIRDVLMRVTGDVDGVAGINTLQKQVRRRDGSWTFVGTAEQPDAIRDGAGVSGVAIRNFALDFARSVSAVRDEFELDIDLLSMGGVSGPDDAKDAFDAGANCVQVVTAAFCNAGLAAEITDGLSGDAKTPSERHRADDLVRARILDLLNTHRSLDELDLEAEGLLSSTEVRRGLEALDREGLVTKVRRRGTIRIARKRGVSAGRR